ncbi:MAG: NAD-dependent epimerase/dehydratase family protein [Cephaloticoccus sp.]|nr:NAD-dependent epimerase/dehydratase family protein [Cephaloticoccus sp.]MCF7761592.1 NAD-dependent epimerase/dehydratase family protein [Cephaloticoccus sp.]
MTQPKTDQDIENLLSAPTPGAVAAVKALDGDFMVLGVGGKMGTSLAVMLRRALDAAGKSAKVYGVSRFSRPEAKADLEQFGITPVSCDLADPEQVAKLPEVANIEYLAGQKFGTAGAPDETWIQNTIVPSLVARKFRNSRTVVFSTGCVYPYVPISGPGANEATPVAFLGEYASTCVGRERVFTHFSRKFGTPQLIYRLNYSVELRYGVLVDIAAKVLKGEAVDVTMGSFNLIWQGDACARAIQCLQHVASPPKILNVTGPEKISIRSVAEQFGQLLGKSPVITGTEAEAAWIADASESIRLFGPVETTLPAMMQMVAEHQLAGGKLLGKPTHFETRDGKF